MQQNQYNTKIPKHLSIPLDLAFHQPYHSIHIQETSFVCPDHHKENAKRIYISDHPILDKHTFDELFQQSEYFTQTHPSQNKTKKHNKSQTKIKKSKSQIQNKNSTTKNKILK